MNILITGGAGYIGSELVKTLSFKQEVETITIYDNLSRGNFNLFLGESIKSNKVKFVLGEIQDSRKLRKIIKNVDVVYHLAAKTDSPHSDLDSHYYEQTNHWGTAELTYAVEESNVKKLVFLSSTAVYGVSEGEVVLDETHIPSPKSFYGISKLRAEEHVKRFIYKSSPETYILRAANVYGFSPSVRFDTVINKFMFDSHFNNRISIHGNGHQVRPFVYIHKLIQALEGVVFNQIPSGIFNVVDNNSSILDILDVLKELYPMLEFIFINQHLSMSHLRVSDSSELDTYLKYNPVDLKTCLAAFKDKFSF